MEKYAYSTTWTFKGVVLPDPQVYSVGYSMVFHWRPLSKVLVGLVPACTRLCQLGNRDSGGVLATMQSGRRHVWLCVCEAGKATVLAYAICQSCKQTHEAS